MSREVEDLNRRLLRARDAMDRADAEPLDVPAVAAVAISPRRTSSAASVPASARRRTGTSSAAGWSARCSSCVRPTAASPTSVSTSASLEKPGPPMHDEATAEQLRELIAKGAVGFIAFQSEDVRGLYETLKARGVTDFTQEPTDHFYGTDMGVRDPFGNAIRIFQPAKVALEATA